MLREQVSGKVIFFTRRRVVFGPFWLVLALAGVQNASAASTILSTGFESPYTPGPLQGQPTDPPKWVTAGSGGSSATVQSAVVKTGTQAVRVDKLPAASPASTDRRWAIRGTGYPTQRFVIIDWDMRVSLASNVGGFGPFFGMEAYDDTVNPNLPYVLGSLGVDASTGDVLYQAQGSGFLTETGTVANFGQWNHFRLLLDFASDTYRGYFNGALVANTGFVDGSFGLDHFTDGDIAALDAATDPVSLGNSASAYFDNVVIRDGLLGDYDIDGDVDAADYTRWRTTYGNAVSPAGNLADGNQSGIVDAGDYVIWRASLGANVASAAGLSGNIIPEPSTLFMLLASLNIVMLGSHRRRC